MARMTKLDAVNLMLSVTGETAVSSIYGTSESAATCVNIINETLRDTLIIGWGFNTDKEVKLVRSTDNTITVPENALVVFFNDRQASLAQSTSDESKSVPMIRGTKMYDPYKKTFEFTTDLEASVIYLFEFDDLPEPFKIYIAKSAARKYATRFFPAQNTEILIAEEKIAFSNAKKSENLTRKSNIFDNPSINYYRRRGM